MRMCKLKTSSYGYMLKEDLSFEGFKSQIFREQTTLLSGRLF